MNNKWGMHSPNKDPTEISLMVSMGLGNYTVVDKWEAVSQIRAVRPNALILLRPYFTGGLANDPVLTAQRSCDHAIQFLDKTKHLVIGNELNIEGPFEATDPDSWKRMNEWVLKTAEVVRRNLPEAILHFPAISPGVGDDPDIMDPPGLEYCREAIDACDILDQHVYWPGRDAPVWAWEQRFEDWYGRRMKWHHALFPNKYIFLSECGPDDVRPLGTAEDIIEWFRILEAEFAYVLGGSLFMWNWGLENDYLNYYDKPYITEPLRDAEKKQFELPKTWVYGGDDVGAEIKVKMNGSIQTMDLEEYVRGVVPREAIASWGDLPNGMEVLKAQAVAARTYAAYAIFHPRHGAAAVCTTTCCQVWTSATDPRTDRAVRETAGAFVTEDGDIIQTQYVSKCGLPQCPLCLGQNGHAGKQWPGRMCQWGAKFMAVDQGKTWRQILQLYYPQGDWGDDPSDDWIPFSIRGVVKVNVGGFELEIPVEADLEVSEKGDILPV